MLFDSSLRKELARSFGATLIVLVTVVMTITLIRTLGQASRGSFNPSDVMLVMGYNVLTFLPNIMTMALFIAMVYTLSRLYIDSEMVIWFCSGVGLSSLIRPMVRFAWPVLLAVAALSLFVLPWSNQQIEDMKNRYESRGDLDRVQPGQFQESANGNRVFFIEKNLLSSNSASNVFVSSTESGKETITSARRGHAEMIGNDRFLVLEHGQRLEITTGKPELKFSEFEQYSVRVAQDPLGANLDRPLGIIPTLELLRDLSPPSLGELSWRIGFFMAAFNLIIIALAATRVNPRIGRSGNLFFSLLIFQFYLNLLVLGQTWISSGQISFIAFNILLHGGTLLTALLWLGIRQFHWHWRLNLPKLMPRKRSEST